MENATAKAKNNRGLASGLSSGSVGEVTENIQMMKTLHELKMAFSTLPDEVIKNVVLQVICFFDPPGPGQ